MQQSIAAQFPIARSRLAKYVQADIAAFAVTSVSILGLYAVIHAVPLNPVGYLDPWFYTGLFTNFGYLFHAFSSGYWVTRLPWIIPGIGANWLLPPLGAFFLLHIAFFVGGALFVYLLVRRFFGARIALIGAATLMLLPLWFDAHSNDYVDGATMTYLLGAAYFGLDHFESRRRPLRLAAAGFFAAAAFGTQIFSAVLIAGLILAYAVVISSAPDLRRRVTADLGAAVAGAAVLLVACGTVARAYGGEFLFFMPSWRAGQSVVLSRWQRPGHVWMLQEAQLLIPLFVLTLLAALLFRTRFRDWRVDPSLRFAAAAAVFLLYLTVLIGVWEFWFGGDFLEVYYYFSLFLTPVALALPACLYLLSRLGHSPLSRSTALVAIAAAAAPLIIVFGLHTGPVDRGGFYAAATLMGVVIAVALVPWRGRRVAAVFAAAAVLSVFATAYAGASGNTTRSVLSTSTSDFTQRRAALSLAMQLESFMQRTGLQTEPAPAFWYDGLHHPELNGIQSTYLWGITWFGRAMPQLTAANRHVLNRRKPPDVVMLCTSPDCSGGAAVLRRAGYVIRLRAETTIASEGERLWIRAYEIPKFKPDPIRDWYQRGRSAFAAAPVGKTSLRVDFAEGLPTGWNADAPIRPVRGVPTLVTSTRPWNYEVLSSKIDLTPGSYRLYLRGRVLRGGIDIGVLDAASNTWISQRTYWYRQSGFARSWMSTPFQLTKPGTVQFILSNWTPVAASSRWQLQELQLVRSR